MLPDQDGKFRLFPLIDDIALPLLSIGMFALLMVGAYIAGLWAVRDHRSSKGWKPAGGEVPCPVDEKESDIGNVAHAASRDCRHNPECI